MNAPNTPTWDRLSRSSKSAFGWAMTSARKSNQEQQQVQYSKSSRSSMPVVDSLDILAGIILSHGNTSEPIVLSNYLGLNPDSLFKELDKKNKLTPENASKAIEEKLGHFPDMTSDAQELVQHAFELDEKYHTSKDPVVELRYLFGGLLLTTNDASTLLKSRWQGGTIAINALLKTYPRYLESDKQFSNYHNFLETFHPLAITSFDSDTADSDEDLVGIGQEVNAFAYLMASTSLRPPLAIGLFGNWGSGKSFFMRSLQKRIDKITVDARNSNQAQKDVDIYKHVVQIEFNAWHYVESDLWASMVDHIFRNLRMHGTEQADILKERQDELIDQLRNVKLEKDVAARRKKILEEQLKNKREDLDTLSSGREEKLAKLKELQEEDILKAIKLSEEDKKNYRAILDRLGLTTAGDSAADFIAALDELKETWKRGDALTRAQARSPWQFTIALIFILICTPIIGYLLKELLGKMGWINADTSIMQFFSTLSAFLVMITGYIRYANNWVLDKIKKAEVTRKSLLERYETQKSAYEASILTAEKELAKAEKELEIAKKEEQQLQDRIRTIEYQLESVPTQLLRGFVDERSQSKDYRDRLGLMALVRRDFEHLSNLIEIQNKELKKKNQPDNKQIINRIVLYIDDLDRCPTNKVVEVLQAVHLLLAFPLFVVMVAVDSRWLSTSLQNHYKELLSLNDGSSPLNHFHQASPHDYLEKIFQIPFWLNPLVEEARMRIVRGLLKDSIVAPQGKELGSNIFPTLPTGNTSTTNRNRDHRSISQNLETNFTPQSLDIKTEEYQFIHELQSLLGESPRSVKRFVNVYRLIKSIALTFEPDFISEEDFAPYKLNLFLLCIVTGLPALSRKFYACLQDAFDKQGDGENPPIKQVSHLLNILEDYGNNTTNINTTSFTDEYLRLANWLKQYNDGKWEGMPLEQFRPWARQVARFSYQVEIFR